MIKAFYYSSVTEFEAYLELIRLNNLYCNIPRRAVRSNSVYVSELKIPIVHADSVSKSLRQRPELARGKYYISRH